MEDKFIQWFSIRDEIATQKKTIEAKQKDIDELDNHLNRGTIDSSQFVQLNEKKENLIIEKKELERLSESFNKLDNDLLDEFSKRPNIEVRVKSKNGINFMVYEKKGKIDFHQL